MCGPQLASAAPLMKKKTATAERDQGGVILQLETSRTSIDSSRLPDHEPARRAGVSNGVTGVFKGTFEGGPRVIIDWGREICGDLASAERREWLCTNGIGGFASGTVAGTLTRRYHGLLVAALKPPLGRTLLCSKADEIVEYEGLALPLFANRWAGNTIDPHGYRMIERFTLEGTTPVWTYAVADALIEKRVWMEPGANTTYVRYRLLRAPGLLALQLRILVDYRDYHATTRGDEWRMDIAPVARGLRVIAFEGARPLLLLADRGEARIAHTWYQRFELPRERERG